MTPGLEEVVRIIGMDAALKLVEAFGGTSPRVPKSMYADHPIAAAIGIEPAIKLAQHYAGSDLYVPRCAAHLRALRDREIVRLSDTISVDELARRYRLSDRSIWGILKRTDMGDGQGDLFGEEQA